MKRASFKFNGGYPVLVCGKCGVILKNLKEFTEEETRALWEINTIPARYCEKCKPNEHGDI